MTEHTPYIDFENLPAPSEDCLVTLFITVRSVARSRAFYSEVLGGRVVLEENPCIVKLANSWVIMNSGGGPTPDKPDISVVNYESDNTVSTFMNLRVADIQACFERWSSRGAEFVTPPIDRGAEIRCYMRDPDGYLIEVGQSTGLLTGKLPRSGPRICPARTTGRGVAVRGLPPSVAAAGVGYGEGFAGNTHNFAPTGMMAAVKYLVEELGADVNAVDHEGKTAMHNAAARGDVEMILYLVSKGADPKAVNREGKTTADMANGPVQRIQPWPEALALLEKLGAVNNHRCVSC